MCIRDRCVCVCLLRHVIQVHVDETNSKGIFTQLGVVTASPDTFTLPRVSWDPNPAVVCVCYVGVYRFGQKVRF